MAKQVTVNGSEYTLDQQGDNPPWGEELSDLLQALVDVAAQVINTGDVPTTSFIIADNTGSPTSITGLLFDPATVRSSVIEYSVYRSNIGNEASECGTMLVTYKSTAGTWELARYAVGDAGVTFTITNAGQVQYTSTDLSGTTAGTMKFRARSFLQ